MCRSLTVTAIAGKAGNVHTLRANRVLIALTAAGVMTALLFGSVTAAQARPMNRAQAVRAAQQYLQSQAFSLKGLISQLKYEGFSTSDATYGASHAGANWTQQAVRAAKEYLRSQAFSLKGLISQLKYGGFSASQATYGASRSGANWMQQAVKAAREYLRSQPFSFSGLVAQLEYSGFTHAQAVHGARAMHL
jgi:hypothetical protein